MHEIKTMCFSNKIMCIKASHYLKKREFDVSSGTLWSLVALSSPRPTEKMKPLRVDRRGCERMPDELGRGREENGGAGKKAQIKVFPNSITLAAPHKH